MSRMSDLYCIIQELLDTGLTPKQVANELVIEISWVYNVMLDQVGHEGEIQ